jgi:ATP-dependent protease ClpP protease subunit
MLAGDQRIAAPHATFMMHSVSYTADGNTKDHEINVNESKRINNLFLDIAATRTKRSRKWWSRSILSHDRYFNHQEAQEIGVLTSKPKVTPAPAPAAKKPVKKTAPKKKKR